MHYPFVTAVKITDPAPSAPTVVDLAVRLTEGLLGIAASLAVLFLVFGGIMYVTARGNDEQLGKAKKTIVWAVIGLIIAIFAYSIVFFITSLLPAILGASGTSTGP